MKICAVCDISARELAKSNEKLVSCSTCGDTVCTLTCSEVVEDKTGQEVNQCGECIRRAARTAAYREG